MKKLGLTLVGGMFLATVAACHTDPFSVKPEVNVTLPDTPAESVDEEPGDTSENPDS